MLSRAAPRNPIPNGGDTVQIGCIDAFWLVPNAAATSKADVACLALHAGCMRVCCAEAKIHGHDSLVFAQRLRLMKFLNGGKCILLSGLSQRHHDHAELTPPCSALKSAATHVAILHCLCPGSLLLNSSSLYSQVHRQASYQAPGLVVFASAS